MYMFLVFPVDIYKHAFDSARKAEEYKFKAKFDHLLSDLHRTLDRKSPHGLSDSFASTSCFENSESPDDRVQQVKQNVSRFLEDILGESLDLTSDEAVSDLSSLSDDSTGDDDDEDEIDGQSPAASDFEAERADLARDFEDLKNFMNLAVIPEETEEELEQEASDYVMVPKPDDYLAPKIGNRDVDQLSDLSDNEDLTDDDGNSFYPGTSAELARISRHKRSSTGDISDQDSLVPSRQKKPALPEPEDFDAGLDYEDVSVGTEDFVGPIVQPTKQEMKLLEDLVPADDDDPKFVVPPESVTIQEGEPVKFSCRVTGTQPIDVFWYREHDEVEELEESEDVELSQDGDKYMATLYNVDRSHGGQYMAIALSDKGKAIKYLTVTVKENKQELKKPEFLKELKDVEVLEGQSVKFRCKVKGYPQPRINWYKDGRVAERKQIVSYR
nr:hypothetical protein BaRGS_025053 [Batillaria attramentaria]